MSTESGGQPHFGYTIQFVGGQRDGLTMQHKIEEGVGFFECESMPGRRFKHIFVPIEMKHEEFIEP